MAPGGAHVDKAILKMLRRRQQKLAVENPGVLAAIIKGANQAIQECQYQFRNRQWNCSVNNYEKGKNLFGKIVDRGKNYKLNSFYQFNIFKNKIR